MRLVPYLILTYIMLGLQVGVSRYVTIHGASPNLGLLAVLYISLNAPRDAALLGSFTIGFVQDLLTAQQPGLFALSYGLVAMLVVALHHLVNRSHFLTHLALAFVGGLIAMFVLLIHSLIHPAAPALVVEGQKALRAMRISGGVEFSRVIYTTAIAPFVLIALGKIRTVFAFQYRGRRK